jgi:hypothetical protein
VKTNSAPLLLKILTGISAVCLLALAPVAAKADVQAIRSFDSSVWASFGSFDFKYKETTPGIPDSERGVVPSVALGGSYLTKENLYVAVDGSISFGDAHYNGAYLYFPNVSLQGTTKETVSTVDGKIGWGFPLSNNAMVIPYVDFGFRYWDRELSNIQTEDYQNIEALGGAMLQFTPINKLLLSAYLSAGSTFSSQMRNSATNYELGSSAIYKVGAKIGYDVAPKVELFTTADYDHFRYGQSAVSSAGLYEPTSNTEDLAFRLGVAYHLQ